MSCNNVEKSKRLSITFDILVKITNLLKKGVFSPYTDKMMLSVCQMAFFAFLRCGEFTVRNKTCSNDCIFFKGLIISTDHSSYTLKLAKSKTDPFRLGVEIPVYNVPPLYPVTSMIQYTQIRSVLFPISDAPLFLDFNGEILSREKFIEMLRHLLQILNLNEQKYCGHSFRIGAATSAASAGVQDHLIQTMGRWSSNCYTRYIRTSGKEVKNMQEKIGNNFK